MGAQPGMERWVEVHWGGGSNSREGFGGRVCTVGVCVCREDV